MAPVIGLVTSPVIPMTVPLKKPLIPSKKKLLLYIYLKIKNK